MTSMTISDLMQQQWSCIRLCSEDLVKQLKRVHPVFSALAVVSAGIRPLLAAVLSLNLGVILASDLPILSADSEQLQSMQT